jgi:hypothetical protein
LTDAAAPDLPKNSPNARLRTPAPPIFTTPRDRYRRAKWKYIAGVEGAFLVLAVSPDLLANIPGLKGLPTFLGDSLNTRIVTDTLLTTGFLSSFPVIRDANNWFLKLLHDSASIPDEHPKVFAVEEPLSPQIQGRLGSRLYVHPTVRRHTPSGSKTMY